MQNLGGWPRWHDSGLRRDNFIPSVQIYLAVSVHIIFYLMPDGLFLKFAFAEFMHFSNGSDPHLGRTCGSKLMTGNGTSRSLLCISWVWMNYSRTGVSFSTNQREEIHLEGELYGQRCSVIGLFLYVQIFSNTLIFAHMLQTNTVKILILINWYWMGFC